MPHPLRLLADADIPFAEEAFGRYGGVRTRPGRAIGPADVAEADVLLVRSVTRVDAALLRGTPVRFVGTATAGVDHVDARALRAAGVAFAAAPGSNAASVVEWVLAALLALAADRGEGLRGKTLGVVGAGHVGGRLVPRAEALGLRVVVSDPPLAESAGAAGAAGAAPPFVPLADLLGAADAVTLHTPLTDGGAHPTRHLLGPAALAAMKPGAWLLNAARGGVADDAALAAALAAGHVAAAALDVWEAEPEPPDALVRRVALATPHVAGYAFDAKVEGTRMLDDALRRWLAAEGRPLPPPWDAEEALAAEEALDAEPLVAAAPPPPAALTAAAEAVWLDALARQAYAVRADDARFRAAVLGRPPGARGDAFHRLRRGYPRRRAWTRFTVRGAVPEALRRAVTHGLGMTVEARG